MKNLKSNAILIIVLVSLNVSCGKINTKPDIVSESVGLDVTERSFNPDDYFFETDEINAQIDDKIVTKSYTVKDNETLMIVAFKLYGDFNRWREIAELNGLRKYHALQTGSTINYLDYESSGSRPAWSPEGNPYLVKRGDTLQRISDHVYKTTKLWKDIWYNNRPLIKDPDQIYAGFTIYYMPLNQLVYSSTH